MESLGNSDSMLLHKCWIESLQQSATDNCCVSIQGLGPSKDPAFAVFEGESFGETSLTASTIVKWDGLDFGA